MSDKNFFWKPNQFGYQESFFSIINPEDYSRNGIDPQDVPMGTFAAEDHPGFLLSRFGGNAYGLGLVEQGVLSKEDTDFLESIDFQDVDILGEQSRRLNAIYQKLGLLIRFSSTGKRYFLIPINLVAHSFQEIKAKADEIEELIIQHIFETRTERLDIGLLTADHDLIVHELTARLSSHRIFLFESIEKLRSWHVPLDIIILPKDPFEYIVEQQGPGTPKRPKSRQRLLYHAMYLAGKIYDLLEPNGKIHVLAHSPFSRDDQVCRVRFKSIEDLKYFLLFSHTFKTRKKYRVASEQDSLEVHMSDLHYYLNRFAFFEHHFKRLIDQNRPEDLSLEAIDELPYLNLRLSQTPSMKNPEKQWKYVFEPYFTMNYLKSKSPRYHRQYWQDRLEIDRDPPESLLVFIGKPRQPDVTLEPLDEEIKGSGMQGCSLPLVAEYRNSFRYVLDVLKILIRIRGQDFPKLSALDLTRLSNPFRSHNETFKAIVSLLGLIPKLEQSRDMLNPDDIEGRVTPILENIPKLSLHGFTPAQLREILLIVVGHTTMSRIVFGKLPAKTLKPITDKARGGNHQEILDTLRVCRLMSMAEIIAALGDAFTGEQARELYRLYDDAIHVATDPELDWERLHDLQISALGGVQNKAVREMMKFFNLFEFLDDWQEFIHKGPFEKEVVCDYQPERLHHLEEALDLSRIADQFKRRFLGDYVFGQSYFFRQFLEAEFHGTGHLFPKLGTKAGFILLWIAVHSAERGIINFNPMLTGIPEDRHELRIGRIKEALLRLPIERLQPGFFEEIKRKLAQGHPAFIFDSGIRIMSVAESRVIDISFVDVEENVQQIKTLLSHLEFQKLQGVSLKNLQDLERRFSELESFHQYFHEEGCYLQCDLPDQPGAGLEAKDKEIEHLESRLQFILQRQIFIPEEIYDTLNVLAKHCPELLRFTLPEFAAMGNLVEEWPARQKQSLGAYVMRCIEKFQALIIKDRNSFQDRNTFYQLAKKEFGPLAEEGIGATHAQLDILEYLVNRIQQRPLLYQALTLALLFQEIGKIDRYTAECPPEDIRWTHAEQGVLVLQRFGLLKKYPLDPQAEPLAIRLVGHHGLIGHVIQGEEPMTALDKITADHDDQLLDVFVLHSILAASAVQESLMVSDLFDAFLTYRSIALQIIDTKSDWTSWLRGTLRHKGQTVLSGEEATAQESPLFHVGQGQYCGIDDKDHQDKTLWYGRRIAAMERLLKLMGASWVDYLDLQMCRLKVPVNFIFHKKKLKSVGLTSFEGQLRTGMQLLDAVESLTEEVRYYLLFCLDPLGGAMRIYDFNPLSKFLDVHECLKFLVIALQSFHHHFGETATHGLLSFRPIVHHLEKRHEVLENILKSFPMPRRCFEGGKSLFSPESYGELHFLKSPQEQAVRVHYHDALSFDRIVRSITAIWGHQELTQHYESLVRQLQQKLPYDTKSFEEELRKLFAEQQKKINDLILKNIQQSLEQTTSFAEFQKIQHRIHRKQSQVGFSEEQQFLLKDVVEFHRARLRNLYLNSIYKDVNTIESREALIRYWNKIKHELFSYRSHIGKEYESLIAQLIDRKLAASQ